MKEIRLNNKQMAKMITKGYVIVGNIKIKHHLEEFTKEEGCITKDDKVIDFGDGCKILGEKG